jgi:hypothetical protein
MTIRGPKAHGDRRKRLRHDLASGFYDYSRAEGPWRHTKKSAAHVSPDPRAGYALLFIYMMAAFMAIMLYMAMPRVAFESQRDKEQLLIDRGEQYKRAVQLYVRKFNRFPADIKALESTQNIRFLRKQYVDPMTGKNEWRLIHVGPGGTFTDSLVYGNQKKKDASGPQTFITEMQGLGANPAGPNQGVNLATRRRPEDGGGSPTDPSSGLGNAPVSGPVMVLPDGRIVPATSTGIPAAPTTGQPGQISGQVPGQTVPGQLPGQAPPQFAGNYGQPGSPLQPGQAPPGGFQNQPNVAANGNAANLINQILTTPRPGGLNGNNGGFTPGDGSGSINGNLAPNTGVSAGQGMGGTVVGGGIAGVASKQEQDGIKLYNERSAYNEWEFVYDMSKDTARTGGAAAMTGQQAQQGLNGSSSLQPGGAASQPPAQPVVPVKP